MILFYFSSISKLYPYPHTLVVHFFPQDVTNDEAITVKLFFQLQTENGLYCIYCDLDKKKKLRGKLHLNF